MTYEHDRSKRCVYMLSNGNDKLNSLKEFMIQKVKGKLKYEEFWALKDVSFNVKKVRLWE